MKKNVSSGIMLQLIVLLVAINTSMAQYVGIHTTSPAHPLQVNVDVVSFDTLADQNNVSTNSILNIAPGQTGGQSIITGMDGELAKVSFILHNASGVINLSIHEGNLPGGPLLTEQTVTVNNNLPQEYVITLPSPMIQIQAGDELFIALTNLTVDIVQWRKSNTNPYPAGLMYLYSDAWYPSPNDDLGFGTYVMQVDTTDTPILTVRQDGHIGVNDYTLPFHDGSAGQFITTDGNGSLGWSDATQLNIDKIKDADGDTEITTEKNPDEDLIRFSLKGTERMILGTNTDGVIHLQLMDTGHNTYIGENAGISTIFTPSSEGFENTFMGYHSGMSNTHGSLNTAIGAYALSANIQGSSNTAIGWKAMNHNLSGLANTAIGIHALFENTGGTTNTAVGGYALAQNTNGSNLTATGYGALSQNTTGYENTATGVNALQSNKSGYWNSAFGRSAMGNNETGVSNTATGAFALGGNTDGDENTAAGTKALYGNWGGHNNTAMGVDALRENHFGSNNTAVGHGALYTNTASNNVAIGKDAMRLNTSGYQNVGIGIESLQSNTSGFRNTALGHSSHSINSNLQNATGIGYNADPTASNQVRIGNASVTSIGGYANWTNLSDGRFKNQVTENVPGLDFIKKLRPVTYHLDLHAIDDFYATHYHERDPSLPPHPEKEQIKYSGFIAQEVESAAREIGYDFSGVDAPKTEDDFYGLRYAEFVVPLVKAVQEQQAQIEMLLNVNAGLESRLKQMETIMAGHTQQATETIEAN